jgi:hypothetical protein
MAFSFVNGGDSWRGPLKKENGTHTGIHGPAVDWQDEANVII